jgi:predicted ferric reductase
MTVAARPVAEGLAATFANHSVFWLGLVHGLVCGAGWGNAALARQEILPVLAAGQISGLVLASCALLQILLASRAPWLERVYGLDGLTRLHHRVGQVFLVPLFAHPLLLTWAYVRWSGDSAVTAFATLLAMDGVVGATIAFCLLLGILVYSVLQPWTSWNYQWWYAVHLAMYAAVVLAFWHQVALGEGLRTGGLFAVYWWSAFGLVFAAVAVYRVGRPLVRSLRHRFVVAAIVPETRNVTSVLIEGRDLADYRFQSGQFVMVRFLCPRLFWESHPYSLSRPYDGRQLRLSVKAVGDFSGAVRNVSPGTRVVLEGPYGIFTTARAKSPKVLCLAFGIGITPIRSIAEDVAREGRDVVLVYGSLNYDDIALREEVEQLSVRYGMPVHHILSQESHPPLPTSGALPRVTVSGGFVTRGYLARVVPDVVERDVFLCGPPVVMRLVRTDLAALGVPAARVFAERFSLH